MFDQFKVIFLAFTGELRTAATIRRYFWVFLSGIVMAILILAYNAFMSLNFYQALLERFTPWSSNALPIITTIAIALTVYLLMSSLTGTILDYIARRTDKTAGHEPMFVAVVFVLIGFLCLDIYANLKGVDYVSIATTTAIVENRSEAVYDKLQASIAAKESMLNRLTNCQIRGYCWQGHLTRDGRRYQQALTDDIAALREQQSTLMNSAIDTYHQDEGRFAAEVQGKRVSHVRLVWFAYPIAFLICFIVQHYVDRALVHTEGTSHHATPSVTPKYQSNGHYQGTPIGFHQGLAEEDSATPDLTISEAQFLAKWKEAVDLILAGHTNRQVMDRYDGPEGQIRGTTVQKLKTVLRAKGMLAEYSQ
jgi:succinate dehydrogenase hydrophobic anchor subunit